MVEQVVSGGSEQKKESTSNPNAQGPSRPRGSSSTKNVKNNRKPKLKELRANQSKKQKSQIAKRKFGKNAGRVAGKTALRTAALAGGTARFVAKNGVRAAGMATMGAIGVSAGIATGDMSNVAKFGIAGSIAGKGVTDFGINVGSEGLKYDINKGVENHNIRKSIKEESEREVLGEDGYAQLQNDRAYVNFVKNKENMKQLEQKMDDRKKGIKGEEAVDDMLEDDHVRECFQNGITDVKDIAAARKLQQETNCSQEEAIATHSIVKMVNDQKIKNMTTDVYDGYKSRISGKMGNDDKKAEQVLSMAEKFQKFREE